MIIIYAALKCCLRWWWWCHFNKFFPLFQFCFYWHSFGFEHRIHFPISFTKLVVRSFTRSGFTWVPIISIYIPKSRWTRSLFIKKIIIFLFCRWQKMTVLVAYSRSLDRTPPYAYIRYQITIKWIVCFDLTVVYSF